MFSACARISSAPNSSAIASALSRKLDRPGVFVAEHGEPRELAEDERLRARRARRLRSARPPALPAASRGSRSARNQCVSAQRDLGFGGLFALTFGEEQVASLLEQGQSVESRVATGRPTSPVAEQESPATGITGRPELEGIAVEAAPRSLGVEPVRALARLAERDSRPVGNRVHRLAGSPGELERARVMVGEHLRAVLAVGAERLDPLGGAPMLLGASCARHLAIGDVADEDMAERRTRSRSPPRSAARAARTPCARARAGSPRPSSAGARSSRRAARSRRPCRAPPRPG